MHQSELFAKTKKEIPKGATFISHQLLLRAGFIYQFASGIYALFPLGFRVLRKIENLIRGEFEKAGIQELFMPLLHPAGLWKKTGRWEKAGRELWKVKSRKGEEMILAMTHEETVAAMAAEVLHSENELPVIVNQFQTKIRDEERPRGGLLRLREFRMQDAYSFDKDEKGLEKSFKKMVNLYKKIFKKMGLKVIPVKASSGAMGGFASLEFMVLSEAGEDEIIICPVCGFAANVEILKIKEKCPKCQKKPEKKKCIEVAHAFKLGEKYSQAMDIFYQDRKGRKRLVEMGCYGIGLERVMATLVEIFHDEKGIIWPLSVAPFQCHLLALGSGQEKKGGEIVRKTSQKIYQDLQKEGIEVLYDDRLEKTAGEKFAEADLIGLPFRLVVSKKTLNQNSLEIRRRGEKKIRLISISKIKSYLNQRLSRPEESVGENA